MHKRVARLFFKRCIVKGWMYRPSLAVYITLGFMNETVLAELRNLSHERGYESPFARQVEFEKWADKVAPRLQFDPKLSARFTHATKVVRSNYALGSNPLGSINEAIGLLNQGILALEQQVRFGASAAEERATLGQSPAPLELPAKITLKWLYANAPLTLYFWLSGLVVGAFLVGIAVTETPFYQALRPRNVEVKSVVPVAPSAEPPAPGSSGAK